MVDTKLVDSISPYKGKLADIDQYVIFRGELYSIKEMLETNFLIKAALSDLSVEITRLKDQMSGLQDENLHLTATLDKLHEKADKLGGKKGRGLDALFDNVSIHVPLPHDATIGSETDHKEPALNEIDPEKCRCPKCKNDRLSKWGHRKISGEKKQQFRCDNCKYVFVPGIVRNGKRLKKYEKLEHFKAHGLASA